jgi:HEAT repeat protein/MFS family permease
MPNPANPSVKLSAPEIKHGMRMSMWDGILAQAFYGLTWPGNVFLTGFALMIGANAFQIGLIAALGPLMSVVYLPAARLLEKAGRRKPYYLLVVCIHRIVYFALLIIPFFAAQMPAPVRPWALISIVFISQFFGIFNNVAWMSWMSDIIPEEKRGVFFGRRNMICGGLWMGASYLLGWFLDIHKTLFGYTLVYAGGVALALLALIFAMRQPDPPLAVSEKRLSIRELWSGIYGSRAFRNFLFFQIAWGFTTGMAGPFYNVYMLENLHISLAKITLWGIVGGIVGTISQPYWGTLGDRAGNRSTLLFALIGSCMTAFGWLLVTPDNMEWMMIFIFALSGFFDTGAGLISFNILLGILPAKDKPSYIAVYEAVVGTIVGFSPMIGGYLATVFPKVSLPFLMLSPVLLVIALSTVLRLVPLVFVKAMPVGTGRSMGILMRQFILANPFKLFTNLYFEKKSADEKVDSIAALSRMKSSAALPDLIASIRDLDPRVRREAVRALGDIGDAQALEALIGVLEDPLEDIQGEAVLALGRIGDLRAVPQLLDKMAGNDEHLQYCAVCALGDIEARQAVAPLLALMETTQRNAVRLACAHALGRIGDFVSIEPVLAITRRTANTTVKHSLVAAAALLIDEDGDAYIAISHPDAHLSRAAVEILNPRTIRLARVPKHPMRKNIESALEAFRERKYNDAILEMKVMDLLSVREYLSRKELKDAMKFEEWVNLVDAAFNVQLEVVRRIEPRVGIALAIVDYYARHCPLPQEPDMERQEFLLALYAFRLAQTGLYRMIHGSNFIQDRLFSRLSDLSRILDVE